MKADGTWESVAFPILKWIADNEGGGTVTIADLAISIGQEESVTANELERLVGAGYIDGQLRKFLGPGRGHWVLFPYRLDERGARAVGLWPAGDAGDVLLQVLRAAEGQEPGPDRKGRLSRAAEALGGLAKDVLTDIAASVVKRAAGLP